MIRTILIDDEPDNVALLALQLARHCPQVVVRGQFTDSVLALEAIRTTLPDLIFLDIEMPKLNGFQLLEQLANLPVQVIFITAYNQYAVQAFRFAALDYLLKPVDTIDLLNAVRRVEQVGHENRSAQLDLLRAQYPFSASSGPPSRLALPHANGLTFVDISQVLYAESDSNYTNFVLVGGEKFLIAKTLGDVQEMLESRNFLRVHRQFVVNLEHIKRLVRGDGTYLVLSNGATVPVSRQQKERLLDRFGQL